MFRKANGHRIGYRLYRSKDSETWEDVFNRAYCFLETVVAEFQPKFLPKYQIEKGKKIPEPLKFKVLVVTHSGFIGEF